MALCFCFVILFLFLDICVKCNIDFVWHNGYELLLWIDISVCVALVRFALVR